MMRISVATTVSALAMAVSFASAPLLAGGEREGYGHTSEKAKKIFEINDVDKDNRISKDEFYGPVKDWGVYADYHEVNEDSFRDRAQHLSIDEEFNFEEMDANDDEYLSAKEFYTHTDIKHDATNEGNAGE